MGIEPGSAPDVDGITEAGPERLALSLLMPGRDRGDGFCSTGESEADSLIPPKPGAPWG